MAFYFRNKIRHATISESYGYKLREGRASGDRLAVAVKEEINHNITNLWISAILEEPITSSSSRLLELYVGIMEADPELKDSYQVVTHLSTEAAMLIFTHLKKIDILDKELPPFFHPQGAKRDSKFIKFELTQKPVMVRPRLWSLLEQKKLFKSSET
ncbi:hypothetical protein BCR34DRAFT_139838 [Clohesyomyces aquaticus]|uniref:Uncharacterized protein n=1 Tax=Clohesyomyces aquaticus TaxID=1231657 RepID=A0A1Y1YMR2_9PLEO|nr:hypothetical protein BCR34DRAFT_139838 [Clohesyomyces aquaticus]